jgi:hypothetical protein
MPLVDGTVQHENLRGETSGLFSQIPTVMPIAELAEAIVELSRQAKQEQRLPHVALDESELAAQFTETRARISQALVLLQGQGKAKRTSLPESWSLKSHIV